MSRATYSLFIMGMLTVPSFGENMIVSDLPHNKLLLFAPGSQEYVDHLGSAVADSSTRSYIQQVRPFTAVIHNKGSQAIEQYTLMWKWRTPGGLETGHTRVDGGPGYRLQPGERRVVSPLFNIPSNFPGSKMDSIAVSRFAALHMGYTVLQLSIDSAVLSDRTVVGPDTSPRRSVEAAMRMVFAAAASGDFAAVERLVAQSASAPNIYAHYMQESNGKEILRLLKDRGAVFAIAYAKQRLAALSTSPTQ